jgi:hypothetical protein
MYIAEGAKRQLNISARTATAVRQAYKAKCVEGKPVLGDWKNLLDWVLPAERVRASFT